MTDFKSWLVGYLMGLLCGVALAAVIATEVLM